MRSGPLTLYEYPLIIINNPFDSISCTVQNTKTTTIVSRVLLYICAVNNIQWVQKTGICYKQTLRLSHCYKRASNDQTHP